MGTEAPLHRGENCKHLLRHQYKPIDSRCRKAIERYESPKYGFLNSSSWVPIDLAAELLGLSVSEATQQAKSGKVPMRYQAGITQRILVQALTGSIEMTLREAADHLGISLNSLKQKIAAREYKAFYKDEHIELEVTTRWEHEKCPLWGSGGLCSGFEKVKEVKHVQKL